MGVYEARSELRRMCRRDLWKLVSAQRISGCLIGGRACCLYLHYKGFNFCASEIIGQGCQVERSARLAEAHQDEEKINCPLPLRYRIGMYPLPPVETKIVEFKVYCRDWVTRSIIFLGNILERRTKERGDNLRDLLIKAIEEHKDRVADPSTIFLLGP
jgi:hypothetical protein